MVMPRLLRRILPPLIPLLLFVPPWAQLVVGGQGWPVPVLLAGTAVFLAAAAALPLLLRAGHGRHAGDPDRADRAARAGDLLLGLGWLLFTCTLLGLLVRLGLAAGGVAEQPRSRIVAAAVLAGWALLAGYGIREARRVPRVRRVEVPLPRLGTGLDGLRVAVLTDTHFGPIERSRWSRRVVEVVNGLEPDIACHAGDLADGTVARRRAQVAPLGDVRARYGRFYITGNHEYFGTAQAWLDHMAELGWTPLHNRAELVKRDGDQLVVAGVDDATAASSGQPGHGADLAAALRELPAGTDPELPVLLLAHQPKQVGAAVDAGVDLQISGHTHGGQIWPFHYLVRLDQPVLHGLSRHGERTRLYTSRGTGFWGPPLRVFAPAEITLLTLRATDR
jgi:uncharacterized protein